MSVKNITEYITQRLSDHVQYIRRMSRNNFNDNALYGEDIFKDLLNLLFGWNLYNPNRFISNYVGIDLIDKDNRIIVQVSVEDTRNKIKKTLAAIKKNRELYEGYHLLFMFLSDDVSKLRLGKAFDEVPSFIEFSQQAEISKPSDILDLKSLFNLILHCEISTLIKIKSYLQENLDQVTPEIIRKAQIYDQYVMVDLDALSSIDIYQFVSSENIDVLFDNGVKCYNNSDFDNALIFFTTAANKKHKYAQFMLGVMYMLGKGCVCDPQISFQWTKKSAENDVVEAQHNLAIMFLIGRGVDVNEEQAFVWFVKAAEQGIVYSQYNVGVMCEHGIGTAINYNHAFEWYKKAANQGFSFAQYNLGVMYDKAIGIDRDYELAAKWYQKAVEQNDADAKYNLGVLLYHGRGVKQDRLKAFHLYEQAASQEHVLAQSELSRMFVSGNTIPKNYSLAIKWLQKAASNNEPDAQFNLGVLYLNGEGVDQNYELAFVWFKKAAEHGHKKAQGNLGVMYLNGLGVSINYELALKWLEVAASQGYDKAILNLGLMYLNGHGVQQDKELAWKLIEYAYEKGCDEALGFFMSRFVCNW